MPALSEQLVLKEGEVFLITDERGDVSGDGGLGLYYQDMRYLSHFTFDLNGQEAELLNYSSSLPFLGSLQFANRIFKLDDASLVLPQTVSIRRSRFISEGLHERFGLANYNPFPVPITLTLSFGADFRDIFDIRGFQRDKWGQLLKPVQNDGGLYLPYLGLDGIERRTLISFDRPPDEVRIELPAHSEPVIEPGILVPMVGEPSYHIMLPTPRTALTWRMVLQPNTPEALSVHITPWAERNDIRGKSSELSGAPVTDFETEGRFDRAIGGIRESYAQWDAESTHAVSDNDNFNALLARSKQDLRVLCQQEEGGYFPAAGIPWYTCPFGRDSLITALQTLMLNPKIAIGTLRVLARYQGSKIDPWREEQPGKILHELRQGEMAHLNMVPHSPYFGTVDATPLFVMLFVETMNWLGDAALYDELLPNVRRAIEWIDSYGDVDGDGFVEYVAADHSSGIRNQVWKDSGDSMQFPDRTLAETPIAAVEVQGYVYAAKSGLAALLRRNGDSAWADKLDAEAATLKKQFNEVFWLPEIGFYAQGLDRDKRKVPTITSNPGHCLWTGIADADKAAKVVARMMQPDMLSGWGIRTISEDSTSYNPMSYHNGSVWPHDNSLVVAGFKRYGFDDAANEVITQILDAARHFGQSRLPELYCGFRRDRVYMSGPAEYPVSCSPQAWAAAAPILMLQTLLGLSAAEQPQRLHLHARLPEWLGRIDISNLRVGDKRMALVIERRDGHEEVAATGGGAGILLEIV